LKERTYVEIVTEVRREITTTAKAKEEKKE